MLDITDITILGAFTGGIVSFASPCILPLVPLYLANIAGASVLTPDRPARKHILLHTISFIIGFLFIVFVIILFAPPMVSCQKERVDISEKEKVKIEAWIERNGLNRYGDPKNRRYRGGTPLFNEGTGESIDRHEYILRKHPDRPWLQQK